ncbi:MAG: glycosyltransferase family 2 protein [Patescibacteria group bacterium]
MISIVIPNFNGAELLKKNLPKVKEVLIDDKNLKVDIIIVDDGSTDNSLEIIENQRYEKPGLEITVLKNEKNMGFSSAVNRGVKRARGEIVILLNTDAYPEKNFLKYLLPHFKNEKTFAVGCMDKSIEDGKTVLRGRGLGEWKRGFLMHRRGEIDKTNTLWVSGGSGAFSKSIWEKLGGFNEAYNPFYWEDIDLSYRAKKAGYKVLFEPKSIVIHEHAEGAVREHYSMSEIKRISYRNQFVFVWINITDLGLQISHLVWLPYHFLKALIRWDIPFFLGFFNALILLPIIIKSSFKYQKLFVKKDQEILSSYK